MSHSSFPAPAPESADSTSSSAEANLDPLTGQSANDILSAERDLMGIRKVIEDIADARNSLHALNTEAEKRDATEASIIQFPTAQKPKTVIKPNDDLEDDTQGFQPVVYQNATAELSPEDEDSGLEVITAGEDADGQVFEDFGMNRGKSVPDEWDALISMVESRHFAERVLAKARPQGPKKGNGRKK